MLFSCKAMLMKLPKLNSSLQAGVLESAGLLFLPGIAAETSAKRQRAQQRMQPYPRQF